MSWKIDFYAGVEEQLPMGNGLFEIRAKSQEGIGRWLFCYLKGKHIYVLHAFVKKSQKAPKNGRITWLGQGYKPEWMILKGVLVQSSCGASAKR